MMSQHINSMLEHLRMGPLKKPKGSIENDANETMEINNTTITTAPTTNQVIKVNGSSNGNIVGYDEIDNNSVLMMAKKNSTSAIPVLNNDVKHQIRITKDSVGSVDDDGSKFDPKKRFSIQAPVGQYSGGENGDGRSRNRELSPIPNRNMQRKLSHDFRFKGSNSHINDEAFELARLKRPVKLKTIGSAFESYDSLHSQAINVSRIFFDYFV